MYHLLTKKVFSVV